MPSYFCIGRSKGCEQVKRRIVMAMRYNDDFSYTLLFTNKILNNELKYTSYEVIRAIIC